MNTLIITRAKIYTKLLGLFVATSIITVTVHAEWTVDFSRRAKAIREHDLSRAAESSGDYGSSDRSPASVQSQAINPTVPTEEIGKKDPEASKGLFDTVFDAGEPVQDIVVMNTEKGFVPSTVRVRKNGRYKISIVNVNEKEKNVSFILDGFSEHHSTYYGKVKTFLLEPKKEGVFSFQSPETAAEGKLVVFNPQATVRNPASTVGMDSGK